MSKQNKKHIFTTQTITVGDRIRAMSDEELVKYFWDKFDDDKFCKGGCKDGDDCNQCRLAFLKQPSEDLNV